MNVYILYCVHFTYMMYVCMYICMHLFICCMYAYVQCFPNSFPVQLIIIS